MTQDYSEEEEVFDESYYCNDEDEDFVIETEDDAFTFSSSPEEGDPELNNFLQSVSVAAAYIPHFDIIADTTRNFHVHFSIPTSIMPLSYAVVNGFNNSKTLAHIEFTVVNGRWDFQPADIIISNPVYGTNFIGKPLIMNSILSFFIPRYKPKEYYQSSPYVFIPQENPSQQKMEQLFSEGFDPIRAKTALLICQGDIQKARDYLIIGNVNESKLKQKKIDIRFSESPLIYLILEITDNLLNILDNCCVCGKKIGCKGLKPSVCDAELCRFSFESLGVGASVIAEIKRDPTVVDFLISIASAACHNDLKWIKIPLDLLQKNKLPQFFATLPSVDYMKELVSDKELITLIGPEHYEILRLIILANHTHLITLPEHLKIKECAKDTIQFFSVVNTPQKERLISQKIKKYGKIFLFHGSSVDRWHSILQTGLQDLGNTPDQQNGGHWFGAGVYQTENSEYAIGSYTPVGLNFYKYSKIGKNLQILALIENAKVPELNYVTQSEYTQQDNDALAVRCIMIVKSQFIWDSVAIPPKFIPTLNDILRYMARKNA